MVVLIDGRIFQFEKMSVAPSHNKSLLFFVDSTSSFVPFAFYTPWLPTSSLVLSDAEHGVKT